MATISTAKEKKETHFHKLQRNSSPRSIVWLDPHIHQYDPDYKYLKTQLNTIIDNVSLFQHLDECIQYLQLLYEETFIVITSGRLGEQFVQQIHALSQVTSIYIFCGDLSRHRSWTNSWTKIRGVFDCIKLICDDIPRQSVPVHAEDIPLSFIDNNLNDMSNIDLYRLQPSFMYTQLFNEIIFDMEDHKRSPTEFIASCRQIYADNPKQLETSDEFERDYSPDRAIWWYTRPSFIYEVLNKSLRLLECNIIIKLAFFIHDLHNQIAHLHQHTYAQAESISSFQVYRGQGLHTGDFEKLQRSEGGLLSFNSFTSTSHDRDVSLILADSNVVKVDTVGVLFVMTIDPQISSIPFAHINHQSYFSGENEVLFSMHTVFQICNIRRLCEPNENVFEVDLKQTHDADPKLCILADVLREECGQHSDAHRLGIILIRLRETNEAKKIYDMVDDSHPCKNKSGFNGRFSK